MPKRTIKKRTPDSVLKYMEGKYGIYAFRRWASDVEINLPSIQYDNPGLRQKYNDISVQYNLDSLFDANHPNLFRGDAAGLKLSHFSDNYEAADKLIKAQAPINDTYENMIKRLKGADKGYIPYINLLTIPSRYNPDEYAVAFNEDLIIPRINDLIGCGIKLEKTVDVLDDKGNVVGKSMDYAYYRKALSKPDGRGYFAPYMGLCDASCRIVDAGVYKARQDKIGWTQETKKKYQDMLFSAYRDFVKNYEELKTTVKNNPKIYDEYLLNHAEHLVDYARDHSSDYAIMKHQLMAYENGWDSFDSSFIGLLGMMSLELEKGAYHLNKEQEEIERYIIDNTERLEEAKQDLDKLLKDIAKDQAKIDKFTADNADMVNRFNDYDKKHNDLARRRGELSVRNEQIVGIEENKAEYEKNEADIKALNDQITKLNNDNKALRDQYKIYDKELKKLTKADDLYVANMEVKRYTENIKKNTEARVKNAEALKRVPDLLNKFKEVHDYIVNKKVKNAGDKRDAMNKFKSFMDEYGELVFAIEGKKLIDTYKVNYEKTFNQVYANITNGLTDDIASSEDAMAKIQYLFDIYGPAPKYHDEWEEANVFPKAVFKNNIYSYDIKEYSFSDKEFAILSMAGTLSAKEELLESIGEPNADFGEALRKYSTQWLADIVLDDKGPRPHTHKYAKVISEGKNIAFDAIVSFATGDKKDVAQLIYNMFALIKQNIKELEDLGNTSFYYHTTISTLNNLLVKDDELYAEFNSINMEAAADKRVDLKEILAFGNVARLRMQAADDKARLLKTAELYGEAKDNTELRLNQLKYDILERNVRRSHILGDIISGKSLRKMYDPVLFERDVINLARKDELKKGDPAALIKEDADYTKFLGANSKADKGVLYLGTESGKKELDEFVARITKEYGLSTDDKGIVLLDGKTPTDNPKYLAEVLKFDFEMANKHILAELKSGNLSKERMIELSTEYMINNYYVKEYEVFIKEGYASSFIITSKKRAVNHNNAKENLPKNKAFVEAVKAFSEGFDYSGMDSKEYAGILESSSSTLYDTAKNIELAVDMSVWADAAKRSNLKRTSLEAAVEGLDNADSGVLLGSKEYTGILNDIKKLHDDQKQAEEEFIKEDFTYNAKDFVVRERKLIKKLEKYIKRKDDELKVKDNETSANRKEAAEAALDALKKRLKEDEMCPTITKQAKEDAANYNKYVAMKQEGEKFEDRTFDKATMDKPTGMELLEAAIQEDEYQRRKYAGLMCKEGFDDEGLSPYKESLIKTYERALYYDMLNEAFAPKENDSEEVKIEKDIKLKAMLQPKNVDEQMKEFDKFMNSKVGQMFSDYIISYTAGAANVHEPEQFNSMFSQKKSVELRDEVLQYMYTKQIEDYVNEFKEKYKYLKDIDKNGKAGFEIIKQWDETSKSGNEFYTKNINAIKRSAESLNSKVLNPDLFEQAKATVNTWHDELFNRPSVKKTLAKMNQRNEALQKDKLEQKQAGNVDKNVANNKKDAGKGIGKQ